MKAIQGGFGGLQVVVAFAAMAVLSMVAIPKYQASMDKAKLTEAFNLAGASKRKLTEFYMVNGRFPNTSGEAQAMLTETFSPPEYVREMTVEHEDKRHQVVIKVFMKPGLLDNPDGGEQYVYIAGDPAAEGGAMVVWSCGGTGVRPDLLPDDCQS